MPPLARDGNEGREGGVRGALAASGRTRDTDGKAVTEESKEGGIAWREPSLKGGLGIAPPIYAGEGTLPAPITPDALSSSHYNLESVCISSCAWRLWTRERVAPRWSSPLGMQRRDM